jgi:hypothetical protein
MNTATAAAIARKLRKLYEADRKNEYTLERDYDFLIDVNTPEYDGKLMRFARGSLIMGTSVRMKKYGPGVCDGASLAPDSPKGVKPAAAIHDPSYCELDAIAEAWKDKPYKPGPNFRRDWITRLTTPKNHPCWTRADVRQLMDTIFGNALKQFGALRSVEMLYFSAVRAGGGIFHAARKLARLSLILALAAAAAASGCSGGCASPDIATFPDMPDIQQIN